MGLRRIGPDWRGWKFSIIYVSTNVRMRTMADYDTNRRVQCFVYDKEIEGN